jgi:methionine sulfoxide reductase heme-binding subunit
MTGRTDRNATPHPSGVTDGEGDIEGRSRRRSRRARRVRNHVALGISSLVAVWAVYQNIASTDAVFRVSLATAWVGLVLFAITLGLGPFAAIRGRRYPVSADIRRDLGIWSALIAIAHVVVGLQVHLRGKMWEYFVRSIRGAFLPRIDPFGAANYAGLAATLIFVALLATSNDVSLRKLGAHRWRALHALANWALIASLIHAAVYQFIEKRRWETVAFLLATSAIVVWLRVAGGRRKSAR